MACKENGLAVKELAKKWILKQGAILDESAIRSELWRVAMIVCASYCYDEESRDFANRVSVDISAVDSGLETPLPLVEYVEAMFLIASFKTKNNAELESAIKFWQSERDLIIKEFGENQ